MQISDRLRKLREYAESGAPIDNIAIAMNETKAKMVNRIFNSETGAKDKNERVVPKAYSSPYKKLREKKGRQTKVVDFEMTSSLRNEIKVIPNGNIVSIFIPSETESKISGYLEKERAVQVFDLSDNERKYLKSGITELILNDLKEL